MVKTVAATRVFEGAEALVEASKFPGFQRAGTGNVGFVIEQRGGEAGTTQRFARSGFEFSQAKRLGLAVFGVVIASIPGKTGTHSPTCSNPHAR